MILQINNQFCDSYDEETYEEVLKFYDSLSIHYKTGYKFKVCVLEQKICVDEYCANVLFNLWPIMNISWGGVGGVGCDFVPGAAHAAPSKAIHQGYKDTHILWNWEEDKFVSYITKNFTPKREK